MKQVGRYELRRELARGGQGAVYAAWDGEREVALKLLHRRRISPEAVERFRVEAEALAALSHPNVVAVHDFGEADGNPFLVMDLVPGSSLQARLERDGPLPVEEAIALTRAVGEALAHAHAQGVIHRDLKPHNVLLAEDGRPLLTDFGLAARLEAEQERLTQTGQMLGTPSYMAPEQVDGKRAALDARTDVYGLGAFLYALLVGRPPFTGGPVQVIAAVVTRPPSAPSADRPEIAPGLDAICARCLAKRPAARYRTVEALLDALTAFANGEGEPPRSRRRWAVGLTGALILLGVAIGVVTRDPAPTSPSASSPSTTAATPDPSPTQVTSAPTPSSSAALFQPASHAFRGEGLWDPRRRGRYSSHRGVYVYFLDARHLIAVPMRDTRLHLFTDQVRNRRPVPRKMHEVYASAVTRATPEPLLALGGPRLTAGDGGRKAGVIVLLALRKGGLLEVSRTTIPGPPEALAFSPQGDLIAFGLRFLGLGIRRTSDLNADLGLVTHPGKRGKSAMVRGLAFSADGRELASGSAAADENTDYSVVRWRVSGSTLEPIGAPSKLGLDAAQCVVPLSGGGYLVGTRNWRLRVLPQRGSGFGRDFARDAKSFKLSVHVGHRVRDAVVRGGEVFTATWAGSNRVGGELRRWRLSDHTYLGALPLKAPSRPYSLSLSPDGKRLAVGHSGPEDDIAPGEVNDLGRVDVLTLD